MNSLLKMSKRKRIDNPGPNAIVSNNNSSVPDVFGDDPTTGIAYGNGQLTAVISGTPRLTLTNGVCLISNMLKCSAMGNWLYRGGRPGGVAGPTPLSTVITASSTGTISTTTGGGSYKILGNLQQGANPPGETLWSFFPSGGGNDDKIFYTGSNLASCIIAAEVVFTQPGDARFFLQLQHFDASDNYLGEGGGTILSNTGISSNVEMRVAATYVGRLNTGEYLKLSFGCGALTAGTNQFRAITYSGSILYWV